jgi:hypothetical protein
MTAQFRANNANLVLCAYPNDVLFGRGNTVNNHEGNIRFRMLALERLIEYSSCRNNRTKNAIARQIVDGVARLGGRFLRKAGVEENSPTDEPLGWMIVDEEAVLAKVKQTFRDHMAESRRRQAIARAQPPGALALELSTAEQIFQDHMAASRRRHVIAMAPTILQPSGLPYHHHLPSNNRPFAYLENAQRQHLTNGFTQQIDQQQEQRKHELALFGQQRATLASQLLLEQRQRQQFKPFLVLPEKGPQHNMSHQNHYSYS